MRKNLLTMASVFHLLILLAGCGNDSSSRSLTLADSPPKAGTYTISGTITAAQGSAIDSDTNDPQSPYTNNDSPSNAQQMPNPVVLGGYLTAMATGIAGDRFDTAPDTQDWYRITLAAGQTISLTIADHDGNEANFANPDFDLFLVDPNKLTDVQTSISFHRQETIRVLTDGDYFLQIYSFNAGSNYILNIGLSTTVATNSAALRIEDEFVPGEVIVRFKESTNARAKVSPQPMADEISTLGINPIAGSPGEPTLYRFTAPSAQAALKNAVPSQERSKGGGNAWQKAKRETLDLVKNLRRRDDVASVDLNYIRRVQLVPDDPFFFTQWNSTLINLPLAWNLTTGASDIVVAVIDTGILMSHPDLVGRLCTRGDNCQGYDFVADLISAGDGDGIDPDPTDPGDQVLPDGSSSFHGTHVAGIVGATGNNLEGVAGVNWATKIMPIRVLGVGTGTSFDVIQGMRYAAGLSNNSGTVPSKTANILNLSFGGSGYSQTEQDLINQLNTAGILVVAAAGNSSSSIPIYPAGYDGVVAVSAVDIDKNLAPYSNYGPTIDVAAPGGNLATDRNGDGTADGVVSTSADDRTATLRYTYVPYMGTSMATPHIAGVASLMLAVDPNLTPFEFNALLVAGKLTEAPAGGPNDFLGFGLIDAQKSVLATLELASGGSLPPSLAISPSLLDFGTVETGQTLRLINAGGGSLNVTGASFTSPWITGVTLINEIEPGSGLGDYLVSIDRTGLANTIYSATITFATDNSGDFPVTVLMQVGTSGIADTGFQRTYLVDPANGNRLQTVSAMANPANGTYSYSFSNVNPGNYLIMTSTDSDYDGSVCDSGEACGGYPLLTVPEIIRVTSDNLSGIDFSSGFDNNRR